MDKEIYHSLILFKKLVFEFYYNKKFCWFRIFGRGLKIKYIPWYPLLFSEKYGSFQFLKVGNWSIAILPKF